uniref:Uncharacterized protein n=1 Tax=Rubinisphaera brasiliensis (strain ATCC 49424 / DSM 5305 / JCM 21570 / IAM 15109 / NBRC 103401 / IFAM 1448) TaxID=756272 RepID=F0SGU7_RUBBR|nr:hypothetical protein Plabr_0757 [Rubinisphaera brasiliensis DSM 5305]
MESSGSEEPEEEGRVGRLTFSFEGLDSERWKLVSGRCRGGTGVIGNAAGRSECVLSI